MKYKLIVAIVLICFKVFAQDCELKKENAFFLKKFRAEKSVSEKLLLISEKLDEDLKYFPDSITTSCTFGGNKFVYHWESNRWKDASGNSCGKKILFYIFYKKGQYIFELNESLYPKSKAVLGFLNEKNINKIEVFEPDFSKALFGARGEEIELIVIYTDDKEIKKIINHFISQKK